MRNRYGYMILICLLAFSLSSCSKKGEKISDAVVSVTGAGITTTETTVLTSHPGFEFTESGYFFAEDTLVGISNNKGGDIYYTTDGSDPGKEDTLYTEPIKLIAENETKATVIKAKAFYQDGTESETLLHTYFVGKDVNGRFDTLVLSVTTDPYNLYDYEYGIFVEGKLRDDFIEANPGVDPDPDDPANFNIRGKEGEREVFLEIFEPNGTQVIAQAVGIRAYGGWSRAREQKSIKIFARKEYDPENKKLRYPFFPERTSVDGEVLDAFKQLVIRNCGNDNGFAFIRDELYQTLAGQAGYQDYQAVRPVAMFVNGDYRGFFWMHEVYCDEYFEDHYGDYKGSFEILEGGELFKKEDSDGENTEKIAEYEQMYRTYSAMDLTIEDNYKKLFEVVDVENYLSYYALNVYLGNEDWPHNNYKTYRYYAEEGEQYGEAPFDGKWRFLPHDMDFSTGIYGTGPYVDNIQKFIGPNGEVKDECPLFGQLMQREDCKDFFVRQTLDLINGAFEPTHLSAVLDEMNASRMNEQEHMYGKGLLDNWVTYAELPTRIQMVKDYATNRASHILSKYQEYFGMGDIYNLTVEPAEGSQVKINSFTTDANFTGSYYISLSTTISAVLPEGKELDYWIVNGSKTEGKDLVITAGMIRNGKAEVSMKLK